MNNTVQKSYQKPKCDIVVFSCVDIISTSGEGDKNQGEWDKQEDSNSNEYTGE